MKKPEIVMIVAVDKNHVIGKDNKLPWHLPADLKHFKQVTDHHAVVMGRKTYESLGDHKLPNRYKIVLTRDPDALNVPVDAETYNFTTIEEFYETYGHHRRIFIIGGAEIYQLFMPYADRIEMTMVFDEFEGDTRFPVMDESWHMYQRSDQPTDERNTIPFAFTSWSRTSLVPSKTRAFGFRPIEEKTTPEQEKALGLASGALAWMRSVGDGFLDGIDEVLLRVTKDPAFPLGGIVIMEHMAANADYSLEKGKRFLQSFEVNGPAFLNVIQNCDEYEIFISKCQDTPYIVARKRDPADPITDYFGIDRTFQEDEVPSRFAYIEVHNLKE